MSSSPLTHHYLKNIEQRGAKAFYLLDLDKLTDNYRQLQQAFAQQYSDVQIAYSFKTNYAPMICATLRSLGAWAEVVSEMEYDMATTTVGYDPREVIVNGPIHEYDFIERALLDGALVNVDAWYLLDTVSKVCKLHPNKAFNIGIRLTYDIEEGGFSRFGIDTTKLSVQRLKQWLKHNSNCQISGFHSHYSNSSRSLRSFSSRVDGLITSSQVFFGEESPQFINIGGGFFGDMPASLANQFGEQLPNFDDYATHICQPINQAYTQQQPRLFLEPGTALIANAMVFVCQVYEVKKVAGKTIALVNGSNHNVNHKWQGEALPIQVISKNHRTDATQCFDVVGNTCIEKDVLCHDVKGTIAAGDFIVFEYMGGYTNVLKQPFINPCQPIYASLGDQILTVKRQEGVNDILQTYNCNDLLTDRHQSHHNSIKLGGNHEQNHIN